MLSEVKLIAEPWDLGAGGYQVGNFPPGWAEWNGSYRDTVRALLERRRAADLASCRAAPDRLEPTSTTAAAGGPHASVNFVTAHDGFTLHDLVSYNDKHNEANGEDNRDGDKPQPQLELRRRRADRRPADATRCASGSSATCWRPCCCRRARRCCSAATRSAARSAATTTPIARTTSSAGSTGTLDDADTTRCSTSRSALIALRRGHPVLRRTRLLPAACADADGAQGHRLAQPDGERDDATRTGSTGACARPRRCCCGGEATDADDARPAAGRTTTSMLLLINAHARRPIAFALPRAAAASRWTPRGRHSHRAPDCRADAGVPHRRPCYVVRRALARWLLHAATADRRPA